MPTAYGGPAGRARLRVEPEHFEVIEELGFEPDGQGPHVLLEVVKRGANTQWVARELARAAGVPLRDVGFAGHKDRHALTVQAFTVPATGRPIEAWREFSGDGFRVQAAALTRRKLRRGVHRGNRFRLVLSELAADPVQLLYLLERVRNEGVPNYFGPQRFGRNDGNLQAACEWFDRGAAPQGHAQRGFVISAARAAIFNAVLAARVTAGDWNRLQPGDIANLEGSGSTFAVDVPDAELESRCQSMDLHPTGPMWGEGESPATGAVGRLERQIAHEGYASFARGLTAVGLAQERRSLRIAVRDLTWQLEADSLTLEFSLRRGAFATAVVHELVAYEGEVPEE
ncbi:MAG TPA: tRNA pseudouridine(13) synthase TruD [Steroidobacteraceae bacterium]|nr:tRNA pseudouridine(13) synthase TruD [Steroidobacteraceae bacterium]